MNLAEKILNEKINSHICFINQQAIRHFDNKIDIISFSLTPRQFAVIKKAFNLKEIQVLCSRNLIDKFEFNNYTVSSINNERMGVYELIAKHKNYIEDFDEREDYIDNLFGRY